MSETLPDFAREAQARVNEGYYDLRRLPEFCPPQVPLPFAQALGDFGVVAEVKPASPTRGAMRRDADAGALARAFAEAGASAVSALVPKERFGGSPENVIAATSSGLPVLFKDFVVADEQLRCARRCGASAVLLILELHEEGLAESDVETFIKRVHDFRMQAVLEVYDKDGFRAALQTEADLIGINNRDLRKPGLPILLHTTGRILSELGTDRPVLALSGCETREDVLAMRHAGANGVLVGSALMSAPDPAAKLRELTAVAP